MTPTDTTVLRFAAAVLLDHPGPRLHERLDLVREALAEVGTDHRRIAADLDLLRADLARTPLTEAAVRYSELFDLRRRTTLNLTWYTDGDTRRRGPSLAALKAAVTGAGWRIDDGELPDHLGALAEFAAHEPEVGHGILCGLRSSIDLLEAALKDASSVYAHAVTAILATLPAATADSDAAWRRLAVDGPPTEEVGLDGYGGPTPLGMPTIRGGSGELVGSTLGSPGVVPAVVDDGARRSRRSSGRERWRPFRRGRAARREETTP